MVDDQKPNLFEDATQATTIYTSAEAEANSLVESTETKTKKSKKYLSRKSSKERWSVLALCCILMGSNHFCCDQPASLYQQFSDHMDESSSTFETYFNLLYTMYSIPNIFLPIIGGGAVDKYGAWQSLVAFCTFMCVGQFIFALGVSCKSWAVMLLGRAVFGIGGESLYTAKSVLISSWFPDNQIALAFGIGMSIGRLGTVIANILSPVMANSVNLEFAIWVGFGVSLLSLLTSLAVGYLDEKLERRLRKAHTSQLLSQALLENDEHQQELVKDGIQGGNSRRRRANSIDSICTESSLQIEHSHTAGAIKLKDALNLSVLFWAITASAFFVYGSVFPFNFVSSGVLLERDYFKDPPSSCTLRFENQCTGGTLAPTIGNPSTDENGDDCPGSDYAPVLPSSLYITKNNTEWNDDWEEDEYVFEDLSSDDVTCADDFWAEACTKNYCDDQDDATEKAGWIMSIPFFMGAVFSAPIGYLSDIYGYRAFSAMLSPIFLIATHFQLAYSPEGPIFPLILQGLAFAVYCAIIWPCVALTVDIRYQGTAYGIINCIMNIGLSTYPLIVAALYNIDSAYIPNVEIFFASSAVCGLFTGYLLNYYDAKTNDGKLNNIYKNVVHTYESDDDQPENLINASDGEGVLT